LIRKTRTLLVEIDVANPPNRILAGSFIQAEAEGAQASLIEVPSDALIVHGDRTLVAVVTPDTP